LDWFTTIKTLYGWNCYTSEEVGKFVEYQKITPEQYEQITGALYKTGVQLG
jgi:uncharacterized XkdX family phage protein